MCGAQCTRVCRSPCSLLSAAQQDDTCDGDGNADGNGDGNVDCDRDGNADGIRCACTSIVMVMMMVTLIVMMLIFFLEASGLTMLSVTGERPEAIQTIPQI